jgi:hypothetical protein
MGRDSSNGISILKYAKYSHDFFVPVSGDACRSKQNGANVISLPSNDSGQG